ncbi:MAG: glyoxalase/bleomycin resistance/dioxygenase family protein, partial [Actinomycetota bacterium]
EPIGGVEPGLGLLGVETEAAEEVVAAEARLTADGFDTTGVADTLCCYAEKTETWLDAPDGLRWEYYVKTGDSDQLANVVVGGPSADEGDTGICCA